MSQYQSRVPCRREVGEAGGRAQLGPHQPGHRREIADIALGSSVDVDKRWSPSPAAFPAWSQTSREEAWALLGKIVGVFAPAAGRDRRSHQPRNGAPIWLSKAAQAAMGLAHLSGRWKSSSSFEFAHRATRIVYEPVGVVGMITPGTGRSTRSCAGRAAWPPAAPWC